MRARYEIEGTNFIYKPHFAGKTRPEDRYPCTSRNVDIIIPEDLAMEMLEDGFRVRETSPSPGHEEGFIPEYFVNCKALFQSEGARRNPIICLVDQDGLSNPLDEETIANLDDIRIARNSVDVVLSPYTKGGGQHPTLYIQSLYVRQEIDDDPFARKYPRRQ